MTSPDDSPDPTVITVHRAQPTGGRGPLPVTLRIAEPLPDFRDFKPGESIGEWERDCSARFEDEARNVVLALDALPGGTRARVLALLMQEEADRILLVVPRTDKKGKADAQR